MEFRADRPPPVPFDSFLIIMVGSSAIIIKRRTCPDKNLTTRYNLSHAQTNGKPLER